MSLTIEISAEQLTSTLKETLASDQWDLLEQVLAECLPSVTAKALEWIGQNGCGFHHTKEPGKESNALAAFIAILVLATLRRLRLALLGRLVHGVQDTEIVLRVLEIALGIDPVAAAGRVAAKLEVFLEKLLRRAAHAHIRAIAVENMVPVHGDIGATAVVPHSSPATAATTAPAAGAMVAATHAFYVHTSAVALSGCGQPAWGRDTHFMRPKGDFPLGSPELVRLWCWPMVRPDQEPRIGGKPRQDSRKTAVPATLQP